MIPQAVVVETPQVGHATYVFAKPGNMEGFLGLYTRFWKDADTDIPILTQAEAEYPKLPSRTGVSAPFSV